MLSRTLLFAAVAWSLAASAADLQVGPGQPYATIQAAVDAAAAGDTISVDAGTYPEQVIVVARDLFIRGAGTGVTVIEAPDALASLYNDGADHFPVVGLQDADVTLADLTVDGRGRGNLHPRFYGVLFRNAGGGLTGVAITGVRNDPVDGSDHGVAVAAANDDTIARSLAITGGAIADFQHAGVDLRAAADTPLAVTLDALAITGATDQALGARLEGCSGTASGLTIDACATGLHLRGAPVAVTDATITGDLGRDDVTGTVGLLVENLEGHADLDLVATGNTIAALGTAIVLRDNAPAVGVWLGADCSSNTVITCDVGLDTDLPLTTLAEDTWWGALDGPAGDGPGSGVLLLGNADVDPWRTDLLTLISDPSDLELSEPAPDGTVVFGYAGGASGRIYGFSIDVQWDPALATATADAFTRPADGPFAAADYFLTQEIAAGHVRVDVALGSNVPGAYSGDLFQGTFSLAPAAPHLATGALTLTVLDLRDNQNQPLAGLVPAPAQLVIDSTPALAGLVITDTTIGSTEWTGDGHDLAVSVDLFEGSVDSLRCDLSAFGGPVLELADAMADGTTYSWTFTGTSGTGDGPVTAVISARDTQGLTTSLSGSITADNTPPAPIAGLVVTPGHQKVHLEWQAAEPDGGSPVAGAIFRHVAWGNYPAYAGPLPPAPATPAEGDDPGLGLVSTRSVDWVVEPRDVYVLAGFMVDLVGNVSAAGESGAATNYWLGDHNGDGVVDIHDDLTALGNSFGRTLGEPGYDPVCDVGPTFDWSPRGVPHPEADGYRVQFEDLMVTALNHDEVSPDQKRSPGPAPDLRWEQLDPSTWALRLVTPHPDLRGLNLRGSPGGGATCEVQAGALLAAQASPVFVRNIASGGLDASVAVIGPGARLEGTGEVLRVVTSTPQAAFAVVLLARDGANRELLDGHDVTGVAIPSAHVLARNVPNPFNPRTTIEFALPQAEAVRLTIHGIDGRLVRVLVDEVRPAGRHAVTWDGRDGAGRGVATGSYFYTLDAGHFRQVRKMTLLK